MRASALPVSLSEVTLNSTTATAAMGTITMIVKKMKSRPRKDIGPPLYRQALLLCQDRHLNRPVRRCRHQLVDAPDEVALEAAQGVHSRPALGFLAPDVGGRLRVVFGAVDGEAMEGHVQLPVAAAVEPVAVAATRRHRDRC